MSNETDTMNKVVLSMQGAAPNLPEGWIAMPVTLWNLFLTHLANEHAARRTADRVHVADVRWNKNLQRGLRAIDYDSMTKEELCVYINQLLDRKA